MRKANKKIIAVSLVIMLVIVCACPASAVADAGTSVSMYLTGTVDYARGVYAVMGTPFDVLVRYDIPNTEVRHVLGTGLIITPPQAVSYTINMTGDIGCNATEQLGTTIASLANEAFTEYLFGQLTVSQTATHPVNPNISYTLDADAEEGVYCLAVFFPGKTVLKQVTGTDHNMVKTILWQESIDYAPVDGASYVQIVLSAE